MTDAGTERKPQQFHIDIDKLANVAKVGVRRAALFMGLGLNAAHREDFNDYELHKLPIVVGQASLPMDVIPSGLSAGQVKHFKLGFADWIVACGFRELIERYASFLDKMHEYCLAIFFLRKKVTREEADRMNEEFVRRLGVPDKLDKLKSRFGVVPEHADSVKQLYVARNCLTHDLGIVTKRRCNAKGQLVLTWQAMDLIARGETSGKEQPLTALMDGQATKEPTRVEGRIVTREKVFLGQTKLVLSQQDLSEICFFFYVRAIPAAQQAFIDFLKANDIALKLEGG